MFFCENAYFMIFPSDRRKAGDNGAGFGSFSREGEPFEEAYLLIEGAGTSSFFYGNYELI
jgi:hypothetical protein